MCGIKTEPRAQVPRLCRRMMTKSCSPDVRQSVCSKRDRIPRRKPPVYLDSVPAWEGGKAGQAQCNKGAIILSRCTKKPRKPWIWVGRYVKTQEKAPRAWIQDAGKYPGARKSRPKAALFVKNQLLGGIGGRSPLMVSRACAAPGRQRAADGVCHPLSGPPDWPSRP